MCVFVCVGVTGWVGGRVETDSVCSIGCGPTPVAWLTTVCGLTHPTSPLSQITTSFMELSTARESWPLSSFTCGLGGWPVGWLIGWAGGRAGGRLVMWVDGWVVNTFSWPPQASPWPPVLLPTIAVTTLQPPHQPCPPHPHPLVLAHSQFLLPLSPLSHFPCSPTLPLSPHSRFLYSLTLPPSPSHTFHVLSHFSRPPFTLPCSPTLPFFPLPHFPCSLTLPLLLLPHLPCSPPPHCPYPTPLPFSLLPYPPTFLPALP